MHIYCLNEISLYTFLIRCQVWRTVHEKRHLQQFTVRLYYLSYLLHNVVHTVIDTLANAQIALKLTTKK